MIRSGIILALITLAAGCGGGASSPGTGGTSSGSGGSSSGGNTVALSSKVYVNQDQEWLAIADNRSTGMIVHVSYFTPDKLVAYEATYSNNEFHVSDFGFSQYGITSVSNGTEIYITTTNDGAKLLASTRRELQSLSAAEITVTPDLWMTKLDESYPISDTNHWIDQSYDPATKEFYYEERSGANAQTLECKIEASLNAVESIYLRSSTNSTVEGCGSLASTTKAQVRVALVDLGSRLFVAIVVTDFSGAQPLNYVIRQAYPLN